jgi:hypothetical protein
VERRANKEGKKSKTEKGRSKNHEQFSVKIAIPRPRKSAESPHSSSSKPSMLCSLLVGAVELACGVGL